ncbi:MAG: DUF3445 domain-containing protein [Sphingomonadaceae bacterium]|jgi:hypothetical protein
MTLGFSVNDLLPKARVSGRHRMGLVRLAQSEWLEPQPDLAARAEAFDAHPDSVIVLPEAEAPARELAALIGVAGGLEQAARAVWEDLCILTQPGEGEPYRFTGGAVAFPTDWRLSEKIGEPLLKVHEPIDGYAEQLSDAVDAFMEGLETGALFGRTNAFVLPSASYRYMPTDDPEERFAHVTAENAGETLYARCERETLCRLPETGAIAFTIGVYRAPLADLSDENIARIATSLEGFGEGEHNRRHAPVYAEALSGYAARRLRERKAA